MPIVVPELARRDVLRYRRGNDFLVRSDSSDLAFGTQEPGHEALWLWHDLVGWFGSAPLDTGTTAVGTTGLHVAAARFPEQPRQVTILGTCVTTSTAEAFRARERLMAQWGDPDREFGLIVEEPDGPKKLRVRLGGEIQVPWARPVKTFRFEVPLIAADPIKYSLTPTVLSTAPVVGGAYTVTFPLTWPLVWTGSGQQAGVMVADNPGSREAWATVRVRGPVASGWRLTNLTTGEFLGLDAVVGVGQTLDLDMRHGRATIGGRRVVARTVGSWWRLARGRNRVEFAAPGYELGQPTHATMTFYPSWR